MQELIYIYIYVVNKLYVQTIIDHINITTTFDKQARIYTYIMHRSMHFQQKYLEGIRYHITEFASQRFTVLLHHQQK
jgi:hypothetical protein